MTQNNSGTWSLGESYLWYSPTSGLDATWSLGESFVLDKYDKYYEVGIYSMFMELNLS